MFAILVLPSGLTAKVLSDKKFTEVVHLTQMEQEWACQSGKGINTQHVVQGTMPEGLTEEAIKAKKKRKNKTEKIKL